jgi:hypothetical protein
MGARNQLLILYNFCVVHGEILPSWLCSVRASRWSRMSARYSWPTMINVGSYIVQQCRGYDWLLQDAPLYLFPAIAMMVVRREIFSHCVLLLYVENSFRCSFRQEASSSEFMPAEIGSGTRSNTFYYYLWSPLSALLRTSPISSFSPSCLPRSSSLVLR